MERVVQILDELDDLMAYAGHTGLAWSWRLAGLLTLLAAAVALILST